MNLEGAPSAPSAPSAPGAASAAQADESFNVSEEERTFRALVGYDGQQFHGWQFQPRLRTVQGELERSVFQVTGRRIRIEGAGRTDQGVHAIGQVASFHLETRLSAERLTSALNAHLPPDVRIHRLEEAPPDFSARFQASWRLYWYLLAREPSPFLRGLAWVPRPWPELDRMNLAATFLLGEWDYRAFTLQREPPFGCFVSEARWEAWPGGMRFVIRSNRFLYRMVRFLVGTLLRIGQGRLEPEALGEILLRQKKGAAGPVAPAAGLYLATVGYEPAWPEGERTWVRSPLPYAAG